MFYGTVYLLTNPLFAFCTQVFPLAVVYPFWWEGLLTIAQDEILRSYYSCSLINYLH